MRYASPRGRKPSWTLQHLRFEPDDAAASADRGENRDPEAAVEIGESQLTQNTRLENASVMNEYEGPRAQPSGRTVCAGLYCYTALTQIT